MFRFPSLRQSAKRGDQISVLLLGGFMYGNFREHGLLFVCQHRVKFMRQLICTGVDQNLLFQLPQRAVRVSRRLALHAQYVAAVIVVDNFFVQIE